jgi:hypothetical protein
LSHSSKATAQYYIQGTNLTNAALADLYHILNETEIKPDLDNTDFTKILRPSIKNPPILVPPSSVKKLSQPVINSQPNIMISHSDINTTDPSSAPDESDLEAPTPSRLGKPPTITTRGFTLDAGLLARSQYQYWVCCC